MSHSDHHFPVTGCAWAFGVVLLIVAVLTAWVGSGFLSFATCTNHIKQEVLSPDGQLKMVVFSRDCGAITGFNSQATIIKASENLPDSDGTVFVTDKDDVSVRWTEANRIVVSMKGSGQDFKLEKFFWASQ